MEQTFITIHNLTPDANILYASESIIDILGYHPQEILGRSCFDYFHPDEVPFARSVHSRGVLLDKAAVLHYARIMSSDGRWISCECCFTIVHDVLVACTSVYRRGEKSQRRALEAPQIRRIFSCSPRDPRYHMLEHLSPKFRMSPMEREPRAALILNRFTRTLSIMFATEAIGSILGVPAELVQHKSFYECIQESSLDDAFNCLESAKANDSIAYLRFWSRDPRRPEDFEDEESDEEEEEEDDLEENDGIDGEDPNSVYIKRESYSPSRRSSDSEGGGVKLEGEMEIDSNQKVSPRIKVEPDVEMQDGGPLTEAENESRTASSAAQTSASSAQASNETPLTANSSRPATRSTLRPRSHRLRRGLVPSVELEAVVSCTSDGLVVVLRRARPQIPETHTPLVPHNIDQGLFAAPWAQRPVQPQYSPETIHTFRPPLLPQFMPVRESVKAAGGPPLDQLMRSIRDVAVFAWALVGINGNIATYGHGLPMDEAQPAEGLPIWDPTASPSQYLGPENQAEERWARYDEQQQRQQQHNNHYQSAISTNWPRNRGIFLNGNNDYVFGQNSQWSGTAQQRQHQHSNHGQHFYDHAQPHGLPHPWRRDQSQLGASSNINSDGWTDGYGRREADDHQFSFTQEDGGRDHQYMWRR